MYTCTLIDKIFVYINITFFLQIINKYCRVYILCITDNIKKWNVKFDFSSHFGTKISDIKSERRFDDSKSSLSSSKYMVKLIIYIVTKV